MSQSIEWEFPWGNSSAHSGLRAEFDRFQVVSRLTDRAVGPVRFSEHYLSHSQGLRGSVLPQFRQDPVSHGGYGTRPKTTGSAKQTKSAWAGVGPAELRPGSAVPSQDSSAAEAGYGQPAYLGQPHQSGGAHVYPLPRIDERIGSTSERFVSVVMLVSTTADSICNMLIDQTQHS